MISKVRRSIRVLERLGSVMPKCQPLGQIGHLAFTLPAAARQVIANREMNRRIREGWYADKLTLVAALTKSASKVFGWSLAAILGRLKTYGPYMTANQDSDLRPEMVQGMQDGAVIEYHVRCTGKNLKVIDLLGIKYVILLRHPADQLAANYCDLQRSFVMEAEHFETGSKGERVFYDHIYPLDIFALGKALEFDSPSEAIGLLIKDGYLQATLAWACDWLRFRDPDRSMVVRYEDFIADREAVLRRVARFLTDSDPSEDSLRRSDQIMEEYASKRAKQRQEHNIYPRGWTGHAGCWRSYFSEENRRDYAATVKNFLECRPQSNLLLGAYPDLMGPDES